MYDHFERRAARAKRRQTTVNARDKRAELVARLAAGALCAPKGK